MDVHTTLITEQDGVIFRIRLVPPEGKPPTLDETVLLSLESAIAEAGRSRAAVVILESAADKYFCVGANLKVLARTNEETIYPWVLLGHRVLNSLEDLPIPVIARVAGYAMGGGLELAMACDLIFAANNAVFGQTEARLGFIPGWGGTMRLVERVGVAQAKRLFFTGDTLSAETAVSMGLADYTGSIAEVDEEIARVAQAAAANNVNAIQTFKKILNDSRRRERDRCAATEALLSRDCVLDPDAAERLQAFLSRKR